MWGGVMTVIICSQPLATNATLICAATDLF